MAMQSGLSNQSTTGADDAAHELNFHRTQGTLLYLHRALYFIYTGHSTLSAQGTLLYLHRALYFIYTGHSSRKCFRSSTCALYSVLARAA
jgi:hypothetical protein